MTQPSHALRQAIRDLQPIGSQLVNAATHLATMRDQLPKYGPLTDEFRDLVATLASVERAYRNADEALLARYTQLEHQERVPNPLPPSARMTELAENNVHAGPTSKLGPLNRALSAPGKANPNRTGDPVAQHDSTPPTMALVKP